MAPLMSSSANRCMNAIIARWIIIINIKVLNQEIFGVIQELFLFTSIVGLSLFCILLGGGGPIRFFIIFWPSALWLLFALFFCGQIVSFLVVSFDALFTRGLVLFRDILEWKTEGLLFLFKGFLGVSLPFSYFEYSSEFFFKGRELPLALWGIVLLDIY